MAVVTINRDGVVLRVGRESSAGDGEVLTTDVAIVGTDGCEGGEGSELEVLSRVEGSSPHVLVVVGKARDDLF